MHDWHCVVLLSIILIWILLERSVYSNFRTIFLVWNVSSIYIMATQPLERERSRNKFALWRLGAQVQLFEEEACSLEGTVEERVRLCLLCTESMWKESYIDETETRFPALQRTSCRKNSFTALNCVMIIRKEIKSNNSALQNLDESVGCSSVHDRRR